MLPMIKRVYIDTGWRNGLLFLTNHNEEGGANMQAYCMKCRVKKEMKGAKNVTMKNGRPATQGVCPTCGTKMFRIGKG
jgi:Zn finger protein HypA/HybF involved in hydrogenase expression